MTKITTDFAGTETKAVAIERVTEILEWWGFDLDSFASWAEIRAAFNELIATPIADGELAASFITKLNASNDLETVIGVIGLNEAIDKSGLDPMVDALGWDYVISESLFSASEPGIWLDPSDLSTLFQDAVGTTPVTAPGDPVGRVLDKSGNSNHATQATAAARPIYGIVPATGRRNLLTWTEDLTNGIWVKSGTTVSANATAAPDGGSTADKLIEAATTGSHTIYENFTFSSNTTYVLSVYAKAAERDFLAINIFSGTTSFWTWFNLATGAVGAATNNPSPVMVDMGDGWYRCSIAVTTAATGTPNFRIYVTNGDGILTYLGDGTSGVYIWGAQLEESATATAYQKVTSQYDVTEAGVPSLGYLAFDGVDDCLAIDLSGVTGTGLRAIGTPHGHQIDNGVPLTETKTPQLLGTHYIAREGAVTDAEMSRASRYLDGDRQYFAAQTYDLTLANLRMYMTNAETPVVRCIGYNGVETTVTLGGNSDDAKDLGAAGLTAPVTVLFPIVTDDTALATFYCYNNQLTGSIPSLSANTALVNFSCGGNRLTGSIPSLSANTALATFYCYSNQLTGSIPNLSANTALMTFHCSNNQLTGSIPSLSANTALTYFNCGTNQLTGSIPSLSANTSLVNVDCSNNQLTGSIPSLSANTSLATFYCYTNQLTGSIPDLTSNTALATFSCYSNQLTGSIPSLSANTALATFYCYNNQLTGSIPSLSANTALVNFSCGGNQLTGSIPSLSANTSLATFYCYSNQLTGSIPNLSANTALMTFSCYSNQLTGWDGGSLPASIIDFRAHNNALSEATVDALLGALDTAGASNGTCKLEGGTNAAPSAAGEASVTSLRGRGWTVTVTGGF